MNGSAQREHEVTITPSRRAAYRPLLSVIMISTGDRRALEGALAAVFGRCTRMEAEVIVVRAGGVDAVAPLTDMYPKVVFVEAPADCSDRDLRDIGMGHAKGDIVSLRSDATVGDGAWLSAFHATVGTVDDERPMEVEVALAVSFEESGASADRRRPRTGQIGAFGAPSSGANGASRRRSDTVRATAGFADVTPLGPTLGTEM